MHKTTFLILVTVFALGVNVYAQEQKNGTAQIKEFDIYTDKNSPSNHFIPSGWMGDQGDIKFNDQEMEKPAAGATCIKITYTAKKSKNEGWAGIYWQSAEHNWGVKQTGFDLSDYNKLTFKAKGSKGDEIISSIIVGGIIVNPATGEPYEFPDSTNVEYGPIRLTSDWQEYSVNLSGKDMSYINGGMAITFKADQVSGEQTIYLDDIKYAYDATLSEEAPKTALPFYVYADTNSLDNHFVPSGWMPGQSTAQDVKLDASCKDAPQSGQTCVKVEYQNNSGVRWAGIYWQNPANNWGAIPNAGFNLQGATKLTFWAKGTNGGEVINEFKMGGISGGEYLDSDTAGIGPVKLTKDWQKYEIDLRGKDLSYVIGGFCWATNIDVNDPKGITFYLDEIRYE